MVNVGSWRQASGFSLVEMALVLLITGLLAKSVVGPLAALQAHSKRQEALLQLQHVRENIFAHLVAYGALPCPSDGRTGTRRAAVRSDQTSAGSLSAVCRVNEGFIDAHALALQGRVSDTGSLLDPWGREYRYAVSLNNAPDMGNPELPDWTTPGEAAAVGIGNLASDIVLCNGSARGNCSGSAVRSHQIAFVIFSTAADSGSQGLQRENLDDDNYFMAAEESVVPGMEYDDLMVWGSTAEVSYWLLRMGWLP